MPRNSSGVYTLPENPFLPGTVIESSPVNSDFDDIATALTGSLPVDGSAPMVAPLLLADGSVTEPSLAWSNSPGTGWYRISANTIGYAVNGVQVYGIGTDGVLDLGVGIALGNADVSDDEVLEWYKEGTFTPELAFGGLSTGITYTQATGFYTRIGNVVYFQLTIILSSKGSASGNASVENLPYASSDNNVDCIGQMAPFANFNFPTGIEPVFCAVQRNSDAIELFRQSTSGDVVPLDDGDFANDSDFTLSGFYFATTQ